MDDWETLFFLPLLLVVRETADVELSAVGSWKGGKGMTGMCEAQLSASTS